MKKCISILVMMVLVVAVASAAVAESKFVEDSKKAGKATAQYTGNVVTGSVNTVGEAVYGSTKTAVSPIKAFWRSLIGKGKPENIVTDPVNEGVKTVKDATVNTGKTVTGQKK